MEWKNAKSERLLKLFQQQNLNLAGIISVRNSSNQSSTDYWLYVVLHVVAVISSLMIILAASPSTSTISRAIRRLGINPKHSNERIFALPQIPYPYHQKPSYRYPYYDEKGYGKLLYGYGGRHLYSYNNFKPLEGYSRKWIQSLGQSVFRKHLHFCLWKVHVPCQM